MHVSEGKGPATELVSPNLSLFDIFSTFDMISGQMKTRGFSKRTLLCISHIFFIYFIEYSEI